MCRFEVYLERKDNSRSHFTGHIFIIMIRKAIYILMYVLLTIPTIAKTHRALVFGLGKQLDTSWAKIHGDNDVYYVVQMLQNMGYTDIVTQKNEEATKQGMVQAFLNLAERCQKGDIVYIHYSGHGQLMSDLNGDEQYKWQNSHANWDEAWIPYDAYMVYGKNDHGDGCGRRRYRDRGRRGRGRGSRSGLSVL